MGIICLVRTLLVRRPVAVEKLTPRKLQKINRVRMPYERFSLLRHFLSPKFSLISEISSFSTATSVYTHDPLHEGTGNFHDPNPQATRFAIIRFRQTPSIWKLPSSRSRGRFAAFRPRWPREVGCL